LGNCKSIFVGASQDVTLLIVVGKWLAFYLLKTTF